MPAVPQVVPRRPTMQPAGPVAPDTVVPALPADYANLPMAHFAPIQAGPPPQLESSGRGDRDRSSQPKPKKKRKKGGTFHVSDDNGESMPRWQFWTVILIALVVYFFVCRYFPELGYVTGFVSFVMAIGAGVCMNIKVLFIEPIAALIPFYNLVVVYANYDEFKPWLTGFWIGLLFGVIGMGAASAPR